MSDRVAVIGGGISGLAYAHVLRKNGFQPVVFEKAGRVGGVWAVAYPGVRLQNVDFHYRLSDAHVRLLLDVTREHIAHGERSSGIEVLS